MASIRWKYHRTPTLKRAAMDRIDQLLDIRNELTKGNFR